MGAFPCQSKIVTMISFPAADPGSSRRVYLGRFFAVTFVSNLTVSLSGSHFSPLRLDRT